MGSVVVGDRSAQAVTARNRRRRPLAILRPSRRTFVLSRSRSFPCRCRRQSAGRLVAGHRCACWRLFASEKPPRHCCVCHSRFRRRRPTNTAPKPSAPSRAVDGSGIVTRILSKIAVFRKSFGSVELPLLMSNIPKVMLSPLGVSIGLTDCKAAEIKAARVLPVGFPTRHEHRYLLEDCFEKRPIAR